ncbi:MAG: phosphate ABC transporter permease PstA [Pseudomonadota bacterium]
MTTTVDMSALSTQHTSEAANRRARARHWAEWRLKAYGILAILLAASALGILISTVVTKAASVMYEYYLDIDLVVEADEQELERLRDPNPQRRVSLDKPMRDGLKEMAGRSLTRTERRQLYALLSTDAGLELGDAVKRDTSLAGQSHTYPALLDDEIQIYIKGGLGKLRDAGSDGTLRIQEAGDGVELGFDEGAMEEARRALRQELANRASLARAEVRRQENAIRVTQASLAAATDDETRADLQSALDRFTARRDQGLDRAANLEALSSDPNATLPLDETQPSLLISANGGWMKVTELSPASAKATMIEAIENASPAAEGEWTAELMERPENARNVSDQQIIWIETFMRSGLVEKVLNQRILVQSDSSNAELAGIWGAMVGSFWTMIVTFVLAFPLGVMAAIYLEEFAPKNWFTDLIEVNINNLAAVPSIVFGLFGITVLITGVQLFGIDLFDGLLLSITDDPRSTPLAGGFVLALMSLPTIIIAGRASIRAVPPSIRDAALGVGASKLQTATHHVMPLAMPGILTGSIIAMAQALGETAPLIIIGMNAFIQDPPADPLDKANVLPSLIYLWNNNSERLFDDKTALAIVVLLLFLVAMNALAVLLRKRFERRW